MEYIVQNLLAVRVAACKSDKKSLLWCYFLFKIRNQYIKINNIISGIFEALVSSVSQSSKNVAVMLHLFVCYAFAHNFADNNTNNIL